MLRWMTGATRAVGLLVLIMCASVTSAADRLPTRPGTAVNEQSCEGARDLALASYFGCVKKAEALGHRSATAPERAPCEASFARAFDVLRQRFGGACELGVEVQARLRRLLDATAGHSSGAAVSRQSILPEPLPGSSDKCEWDKSFEYCDACVVSGVDLSACFGGDAVSCAEIVWDATMSVDMCKDCCACEEAFGGSSSACNKCIDECASL